jgi:hypothetical protein
MNHLRIGTRRTGSGRYEGVLRDGKQIVATCGHGHQNRDESSRTNGISARHCIRLTVMSARCPDVAERARKGILAGPNAYLRSWDATPAQVQRMHAAAQRQAAEFMASLSRIAVEIGNRPVFGYTDHVEIAPVKPEGVACKHCGTPLSPNNYSGTTQCWVNWRDANRDWTCRAPGATSHEPDAGTQS